MSKLGRFSAALIAVAMFVTPAMAAWRDSNGAVIHPSRVVHWRGATVTAQSSIPPASFTASGLQTLASLPEGRGIGLPANRQPGAKRSQCRYDAG